MEQRRLGGRQDKAWAIIRILAIHAESPVPEKLRRYRCLAIRTSMTRDAQALDHFLRQVERRAFGVAKLAVGQREEALDIVQDAMMKFAEKYSGKPQDEWAPLFYRVMQNQIRDWQRRHTVRNRWRVWLTTKSDMEESDTEDPMQHVADPVAREPSQELSRENAMGRLQEALLQLPPRQLEAFLLRVWEGFDVSQTAKAMAVSEGSVKTHFSRAVHFLRHQLEDSWP